MAENSIIRIKELIGILNDASKSYYGENVSKISDAEYDSLFDELQELENKTGIIFENSPTKKISGFNSRELNTVKHSKPMLSADKTKSEREFYDFMRGNECLLSWKLDGLTIVLRYDNGYLIQAITRGEDGLVGEDITHTVKYMRNVPKRVPFKYAFEVRGEGVISYTDIKIVARKNPNPSLRNIVSGAVRSITPNVGNLSHMDFIAFELIEKGNKSQYKEEQLE